MTHIISEGSPFRTFHGVTTTLNVPDANDPDFTQYNSGGFISGLVPREHKKYRIGWCKSGWSVRGNNALAALSSWSGAWRTDRSLMATVRGYDAGSFNFGDDSVYYLMGQTTTYINVYASYSTSVTAVNPASCFTVVIFSRAAS